MPNKKYINGRRNEYKIMHRLQKEGFIAFRSAGSHSPFDVVGVHLKKRLIIFIQSKTGYISKREQAEIMTQNADLILRSFLTHFVIIKDSQELDDLFKKSHASGL